MLRARLGCTILCWWCLTVALKLAPNLKIESITIHPRTWGIETIKQNEYSSIFTHILCLFRHTLLVRRNRQTNNVAKAFRLASRTSYGMEISQDNGLILINMNLKSIKTDLLWNLKNCKKSIPN